MEVGRKIAISRRTLGVGLGALSLAAIGGSKAKGQTKFPSRPIEVVTHAGVGGGTDITARMMMVQAPAELKTEFVVVNKTGGSGAAALQYASERPRDGHTILLITQTHLLTLLRDKAGGMKYEDLVPLARATEDPQILMVGKSSPFKSAADWLAAGKDNALKYGTTHVGSVDHIACIEVAKAAGHQSPNIIPFRGGGDIVINLVGGNVDCALVNYAEAESQIRGGDIRPLCTFSEKRLDAIKDVPTGKEIGVPGNHSTVRGFAALAGTPPEVVTALEDGLVKAMKGQLYQNYLSSSGQSADSVAGAKVWKDQLDAFMTSGKATLTALGLMK